jgi:hypothetical protein
MARAALAFAVAVFAFPLFVLLLGQPDAWGGALRVGAITVTGVVVIGAPAFLVFRCRGWWEPWRFILGGTLGGLLCAPVFMATGAPTFWFFAILFALGGACHALLFWLIAAWRNPQLTTPPQYCLPGGTTYKRACRALSHLRRKDKDG